MKRISNFSFSCLLTAAILHVAALSSPAQTVIGSWQDNDGDGWTDNSDVSITAAANMPSKYEFVIGVVAGYAQSLAVHETAYGVNRLKIKLTTLGGAVAAFTNCTKLQFTFSCPPATDGAYMKLVQFQVNSPGSGFFQIQDGEFAANGFTMTGDTNWNGAGGTPQYDFWNGSPARKQVVTWDYSSRKSSIMSASIDYLQITFVFQVGGGAPTNVFMNDVKLLGAETPPSPATVATINTFTNAAEVADTANGGANAWGNWYGTAYYQAVWDPSDASNNVNSGSLRIEAFFPDSGIGGQFGPQFLAQNGFDGIVPPLAGNGSTLNVAVATNVSFDVRFDPTSVNNGTSWPTLEVGTRGSDLTADTFGTVTIPLSQTNWTKVNIPIAASEVWTNIPNIFIKHYSDSLNGWVKLYVDNIQFTMASVPVVPPTMAIAKATPGLRFFAGPNQYNRTQIASVNTHQSWVGGAYPVSYSFTVSGYDTSTPLDEFHVFLLPLNYINGGTVDQYSDYSTASNSLRIQITGLTAGSPQVACQLAWKTNLVGANPNNVALNFTNATAAGMWTLTFSSATAGTLTAPGASPLAFSMPANAATTFANPLVAVFGVQPNPTTAIGQYVDLTSVQTLNVAAPGVAINSPFTNGAPIDTNIWLTASVSQDATNLKIVDSTHPWWVNWTYPDVGFALGTKADLGNLAVSFKTPAYFTGYDTNNPIFKKTLGTRVKSLIPQAGLPTVSGLSNGVPAGNAFFRLSSPAPTQ